MSKVYEVKMTETATFFIKADDTNQVNEWLLKHSLDDVTNENTRVGIEYNEEILGETEDDSDVDFDIHTETEAVECCPWCDGENVYKNWNVKKDGYIANCEHCGEKIFLCDECLHAEDNLQQKCDWRETSSGSKCFRGEIRYHSLEVFLYKGKKYYKKDLYIPEFGYRLIGTDKLSQALEANHFNGTDKDLDEQFFFYVPENILFKPDKEVIEYVVKNLF